MNRRTNKLGSQALLAAVLSLSGGMQVARPFGMPPRGIHFDEGGGETPPGETPPGETPPGTPPIVPPKKEPLFSDEQQKVLERLNNEAFGKGFKKAEAQAKADREALDALKAQVDELKKLATPPTPDPNIKKPTVYSQEEVQKLIEEAKKPDLDALKAAEDRSKLILEKEKKAALRSAAVKAKAADDEDVAKLLYDRIVHNADHELVVLNSEGHPALDASGKPQSVDAFVKAFIDSKPHLQASSGRAGAGSGNTNRGGTGPSKPPKNMSEATSAFAKAMEGHTIQ